MTLETRRVGFGASWDRKSYTTSGRFMAGSTIDTIVTRVIEPDAKTA